MSSLFKSNNITDWKAAYLKRDEYVSKKETVAKNKILKSKRKNKDELIKNMKLVEFDKYLFNELHQTIKNRNDNNEDHIKLMELSTIMKWKLFRGQFRPRLQTLIDSNNANDVIKVTKNAFNIINKTINDNDLNINILTESIKILIKLKGVGIATASLILAVYTKIVPFMADESMLSVTPGMSLKYDKKTYLNYVNKLIIKCNTIKSQTQQQTNDDNNNKDNDDEFVINPFVLGECLWTDFMIKKLGDNDQTNNNKNKKKTKTIKKKSRKRKVGDVIDDLSNAPKPKKIKRG